MSNMFDNYNYIPQNYAPANTKQLNVTHPAVKLPLEEYNDKGDFIGFSWKYHDAILLEFKTEGNVLYDLGIYEDAETYLDGKKFLIEFFNFRYEIIYSEEVEAQTPLKYYLSEELRNLLLPNTYAIQVTLIDEENDIRQVLLDKKQMKVTVR